MALAVWGRRGKSLYDLVSAVHVATPHPPAALWSDDVDSVKELLAKLPLPTVCGSRNEASRDEDVPGRLLAANVIRAVVAGKDVVLPAGVCLGCGAGS